MKMRSIPRISLQFGLLGVVVFFYCANFLAASTETVNMSSLELVASAPITASQGNALYYEVPEHNYKKFRQGYELLSSTPPNFEEALKLFEENIAEFPKARDLDYDYGWAMICAAHLKKYAKALEYYRTMRIRFGDVVQGAGGGAMRVWNNRLEEFRMILQNSSDTKAIEVLGEVKKIDEAIPSSRDKY